MNHLPVKEVKKLTNLGITVPADGGSSKETEITI